MRRPSLAAVRASARRWTSRGASRGASSNSDSPAARSRSTRRHAWPRPGGRRVGGSHLWKLAVFVVAFPHRRRRELCFARNNQTLFLLARRRGVRPAPPIDMGLRDFALAVMGASSVKHETKVNAPENNHPDKVGSERIVGATRTAQD